MDEMATLCSPTPVEGRRGRSIRDDMISNALDKIY